MGACSFVYRSTCALLGFSSVVLIVLGPPVLCVVSLLAGLVLAQKSGSRTKFWEIWARLTSQARILYHTSWIWLGFKFLISRFKIRIYDLFAALHFVNFIHPPQHHFDECHWQNGGVTTNKNTNTHLILNHIIFHHDKWRYYQRFFWQQRYKQQLPGWQSIRCRTTTTTTTTTTRSSTTRTAGGGTACQWRCHQ